MTGKSNILIVTNLLSPPFDEGMRIWMRSLYEALRRADSIEMTLVNVPVASSPFRSRLRLLSESRSVNRECNADIILYVPLASMTFNSFLFSRLLRGFSGRRPHVSAVSLQHRTISAFGSWLVHKFLKPDLVFTHSPKTASELGRLGVPVHHLNPAVDAGRFRPADAEEKFRLRLKYRLPEKKFIILHVGHATESRNLDYLTLAAKEEGVLVVFVASSRGDAKGIATRLAASGVHVIGGYQEAIDELYKLSDLYLFPVEDETGAIDLPLSVLESLSCGLPVLSSRFPSIIHAFEGREGVHFFSGPAEFRDQVANLRKRPALVRSSGGLSYGSLAESILTQFRDRGWLDSIPDRGSVASA